MNPYQAQIDQLQVKLEAAKALAADPEYADLARAEIIELRTQIELLTQAASQLSENQTTDVEVDSTQKTNCTMEFRPGTGGDEAKIWASDLLRMYVRYLETTKFRVSYIDDFVIKIVGKNVFENDTLSSNIILTPYEIFQYESGVHRVQRVPETEAQGRIHTSTATVAVLPEVPPHVITIRDEDLEWQFIRASGAGGQHVNKTSSAVRLTHIPTGIATTCQQEKRQEQNRKIALELLRAQLWEIEEEKRLAQLGEARSAIGQARRAEKIRTYNYPQNRITDHRTKQSWHNLESIINGNLETLLLDLRGAMENLLIIPTD
ncbi:MAG TPA: PCRF domain-containing protein [Candidatus Woesebacteria bacterium]|nr:PCRF domain-containing protein [Candidatus Woesebacteria bacterium]HNS65406.1 PCRF domain-containing protein [Candidatus Woesebacteria bacterium]